MNKYKRLISNSIIFAIGNLTGKAAQFFILPMLTKYLLESQYGITDNVVTTISDLFIPLLTLGLAEALFRFSVDKKYSPNEIITNSFTIVFIGSLVFAIFDVAFYFIANYTGSIYSGTYLLLLIPLFVLRGFKGLLCEFTRGIGKTVNYAVSSIIEAVAMLLTAYIAIVPLRLGINGYLLSLIVAPIVVIILLTITVNPWKYIKIHDFNKITLKEMLKYSIPNVSNSISWWIVQTSGRYLMVYLSVITIAGLGKNEELYEQAWTVAGLVTAASKLPALINVVSSIFLQAWSLSSAQESESSDRNEFYSTVFKYYTPIIFLATGVIILIVPYISKFLLKNNFYEAWVFSPILIMGAVSGCFSAFFGAFFGAYYKTKYSMYSTFIGAGVNLAVCCIFMPIFAKFVGLNSVVYVSIIAFWLSYTVIFVTRVLLSKKLVKINTNWFKFIAQYMLLMVLAVVYTLNVKYKWAYATVVILLIFIINMREIIFIIKKFCGMLKRGKKIPQLVNGDTQDNEENGKIENIGDNEDTFEENNDNE